MCSYPEQTIALLAWRAHKNGLVSDTEEDNCLIRALMEQLNERLNETQWMAHRSANTQITRLNTQTKMHYALLDGPQLGYDLPIAQVLNPNNSSLDGDSADSKTTPVLFWYEPNESFVDWLDQHWGEARGISMITNASPDEVREHLRQLLLLKADDGQPRYARFYDPRVLKVLLPTGSTDQLREFFGPIEQFVVEDPTRQRTLYFAHRDGVLVTDERRITR